MARPVANCPSCGKPLTVTQLSCPSCGIAVSGRFERGCKFCALDKEQRRLLDVFLSCRGVIRDMEKALGLSYPTVRSRIDALLAALGYAPAPPQPDELAAQRHQILARLEVGEITAEKAIDLLQEVAR